MEQAFKFDQMYNRGGRTTQWMSYLLSWIRLLQVLIMAPEFFSKKICDVAAVIKIALPRAS